MICIYVHTYAQIYTNHKHTQHTYAQTYTNLKDTHMPYKDINLHCRA